MMKHLGRYILFHYAQDKAVGAMDDALICFDNMERATMYALSLTKRVEFRTRLFDRMTGQYFDWNIGTGDWDELAWPYWSDARDG